MRVIFILRFASELKTETVVVDPAVAGWRALSEGKDEQPPPAEAEPGCSLAFLDLAGRSRAAENGPPGDVIPSRMVEHYLRHLDQCAGDRALLFRTALFLGLAPW